MSLKPTDNSFKLTFFKKLSSPTSLGHVLIFYPTQVKLSGIAGRSKLSGDEFSTGS